MKKIYILIIIIFLFVLDNLSAQDKPDSIYSEKLKNAPVREPVFDLGVYGGWNFNFHGKSFDVLPQNPDCCPEADNGSGSGISVGMLFTTDLSEKFGLDVRAGFSVLDGSFKSTKFIGETALRREGEQTGTEYLDAFTEYSMESAISVALVELAGTYEIFPSFRLSAGPAAGYPFTSTYGVREVLTDPPGYTFLGGDKTRYDENDIEIPEASSLFIFAKAGISYEIKVSTGFTLMPEASYIFGLNDISKEGWKVNSMRLGLSMKLPFYPPRPLYHDTLIIRDTTAKIVRPDEKAQVILAGVDSKKAQEGNFDARVLWTVLYEHYEKLIPGEAKLESQLKVYGIDGQGRRKEDPQIVIRDVELVRETIPLLPYVFFERGDAELKNTDLHLMPTDSTPFFNDYELKPKTLVVYNELLNIIGYRMRQNPGTTLKIVGCNNNNDEEKRNMELSEQRAENVAAYLENVWNIDGSRLQTEAQGLPRHPASSAHEDGRQENQRVEFYSGDYELLAPVVLKSFNREVNYPEVKIMPAIVNDVSLKSHSLKILQKRDFIRKYEDETPPPAEFSWKVLEEPLPPASAPVQLYFRIEDKLGNIEIAENEIPLEYREMKMTEGIPDRGTIIERYYIIAHFDSPDILENLGGFLEEIKSKITDDAEVTISGYADRTGTEESNLELAKDRVDDTERRLNVPEERLTRNPVGSTVLLYDNDLPQGRAYSRAIRIDIKKKIK